MLTEMILDKLGVFYEDLAHKKHGNSPEISWGNLVDRILINKGKCSTYTLFPEIGQQTFNRMMRKCFPSVRLQGGGETWYCYLLTLIGYKNCGYCDTIQPITSFHKGSIICRQCCSIKQTGSYAKYIDVHKKSYEKNYAKIKARRQLYKGERSLRVPPWYETEKIEIELFYENCPDGYHVDHIIPLKGKLVSGLHVLSNLQYLPAKDNMSKGNKFEVS